MNYFAHALPFLDRPLFMAATAVPDWLAVADRPARVRWKTVAAFCERHGDAAENDRVTVEDAEIAAGILQHLSDDAQFHATRAFAETSMAIAVMAREVLCPAGSLDGGSLLADSGDAPVATSFLGHLLVELLLDAALAAEQPERLAEYYRILETVDPRQIEALVNQLARRPTCRLAPFIELYRREGILWDYADDRRLMRRLNQIMRRVGLALLPDAFADILPAARKLVVQRRRELYWR